MSRTDLDDAFRELERRADAFDALPRRPAAGHRARPVLVAASVAAVLAVAAGTGVALIGSGTHERHDAARPAPTVSTTAAPSTGSASATRSPSAGKTDVPADEAALAARLRQILGRSAAFTVDHKYSTRHLITGVMTATSGGQGFYVLELFDTDAPEPGLTPTGTHTVTLDKTPSRLLADGSRLQVDDDYADGPVHGLMNDAILTRPDGWQISLYTSNVKGKYVGAPVLGDEPALPTEQVKAAVTSPDWVRH